MKKTLGMLCSLGLSLSLGLGCTGEKGDKGDPGDPGQNGDNGNNGNNGSGGSNGAAVSLLVPLQLFAGHKTMVQISGSGTHFADGSGVEFGDPEIKVSNVAAGSSVNLRALVESTVDVTMGAHDLNVNTPPSPAGGDAETVTLKGGLTVVPSLGTELPASMMPGKVAQGGITDFAVRNFDDRDNPFATTGQTPQIVRGVLGLGNLTIATNRIAGVGLADALAPAGGLRLAVMGKDRQGQDLGYASDPAEKNAIQVVARPAADLAAGMGKTGEVLGEPRATGLYKLTTTMDNQVAHVAFTTLGTSLSGIMHPNLVGYMAPSSGRFRDGHVLDTSETPGMVMGTISARNTLMFLPKAGDYYFVVYASDFSGSMNHSYTVTARWAEGANLGSLKENLMMRDTPAMPLGDIMALDKPYYATDGAADDNFDEDFVRFKATKTGRVYMAVTTTAGSSMGLGVRQADCSTILVNSRYSPSGIVLNEADVVDGTTYCVRVAGNGQPANYQLMISPSLN